MHRVPACLSAALALAVCVTPPAAAAQPATATLTGVATAADGSRLPGVNLVLAHEASGSLVRAATTGAGMFHLDGLPPGRYQLDADLPGFEPRHVGDIVLAPGATVTLAVQLEVATVSEQVRVVGVAPRDSVEASELRESRARDVGEALTALPGLVKLRRGAIANDVVVRGFQGKDVTVLIDGQRLDGACPGHMDPPAFHVDFAEVSRIEVNKGPFDVKNQGGLAGAVNVVTERPQRGWHGSANLMLASAATLAPSASFSGGGATWAALGGGSWRRADPYADGEGVLLTGRANYSPSAVEGVAAYDVWTGWGRLALVPRAGTTLQVSYTRQSADTIVYPYLQMDAGFDTADRAGARLEIADLPGGWRSLAAQVYYTQVDHWMTDELRTSAVNTARGYSMATSAQTSIAGGKAEIQRGPVTLGLEASRRRWNTTTMLAMQKYVPQAPLADATIDVVGAFGAYSVDLGARWHLDAGGRLDRAQAAADALPANTALYLAYHGTTDTRASDLLPAGHVRAAWRHASGWTAAFGLGHASRPPDQQERYYALRRMGSDWVGNPTLAPARNTGADVDIRYTGHGIDAGIATFVYRVDGEILVTDAARALTVPGVMNSDARSYANVDALVRGVEASATLPLARAVFLSADGSFVRGTTREATSIGPNLPEMPPARARVRLRYDDARWNASAEVVGAAAQDEVATALHESPTPAFAVLNLRGGLRLRQVEVTVGIDNLLDAFYAEHLSYQRDPFRNGVRVYEPGRTFSASVGARF